MEILIRRATNSDIEQIVGLWHQLMEFHNQREISFEMCDEADPRFREFLTSNISDEENSLVIVAENKDNQKIVAYCMAMIGERPPVFKIIKYGWITDFCVAETYRRRGIGRMLFEFTKLELIKKGITRIELQAATKNEISPKFWRQMGGIPYLETLWFDI